MFITVITYYTIQKNSYHFTLEFNENFGNFNYDQNIFKFIMIPVKYIIIK